MNPDTQDSAPTSSEDETNAENNLSASQPLKTVQPLHKVAPNENQTVETPSVSAKPPAPFDVTKIYPDANSNIPTIPNDQKQTIPTDNAVRVSAKVSALQVYAFLIIIYGAYILFSLTSIFAITRTVKSPNSHSFFNLSSPIYLVMFGLAAIYIAVGLYLLMARNAKTVSSVLMVMLILGGLGLLNSVGTVFRYLSLLTFNTFLALFISIGLLMYLYSVKTQVDLLLI